MKEKAIRLLKELTNAHGASGFERAVRQIFINELPDQISTDRNGSVICTTAGQTASPKIMLEAHMDEVGFMVQSITEDGYLKIVALGGWWSHTLLSQRVRILTQAGEEVVGVITCKPPHYLTERERKEVVKIENMYIDVGAQNVAELKSNFGINLGDSVVPDTEFIRMQDPDLLLGKAFDNRVGVGLAIHTTQIMRKIQHPNTLYTVGAVQEEVGVRGIQSAVNVVNPDVAIILEGAPADDFPGSSKNDRQTVLGKGPANPANGCIGNNESSLFKFRFFGSGRGLHFLSNRRAANRRNGCKRDPIPPARHTHYRHRRTSTLHSYP